MTNKLVTLNSGSKFWSNLTSRQFDQFDQFEQIENFSFYVLTLIAVIRINHNYNCNKIQ